MKYDYLSYAEKKALVSSILDYAGATSHTPVKNYKTPGHFISGGNRVYYLHNERNEWYSKMMIDQLPLEAFERVIQYGFQARLLLYTRINYNKFSFRFYNLNYRFGKLWKDGIPWENDGFKKDTLLSDDNTPVDKKHVKVSFMKNIDIDGEIYVDANMNRIDPPKVPDPNKPYPNSELF